MDLVCFSHASRALRVLLARKAPRSWELPTAMWRAGADIDRAARVVARTVLRRAPAWTEQVGAITRGAHARGAALSVVYVAVVRDRSERDDRGLAWHDVAALPRGLAARQRSAIVRAHAQLRGRLDSSAVASAMLAPRFTLAELQRAHEAVLGRTVHKASFRRTLRAAASVTPTAAWRGEGRGRPAQLYRPATAPRGAGGD